MSEIPAVVQAQATRLLNKRIEKHFKGMPQEKLEETILKIYQGCDQACIQSGRYIFPPGLDPIIVYSSPIAIRSLEDGREYITTIGEVIELVATQFALSFDGLEK
jgi:hypothetical protein